MSDIKGKEAPNCSCDLDPRYKYLLAEFRLVARSENIAPDDLARIETYLFFLQAAGKGLASCQDFLDRFALSEGKLSVLLLLKNTPQHQLTPSEIADGACVTRGTITGLLAGLERAGLVIRDEDPRDGRRAAITLTQHGEELLGRLMDERYHHIDQLISCFTPEETHQLHTLLEKLSGNLSSPNAA